jgi:hypothetical protein
MTAVTDIVEKHTVIATTIAVSGKPIRLTLKQWYHITESHDYMAGNIDKVMETVNMPDWIAKGIKGELIAGKYYHRTTLTSKYCIVAYRENRGGFVITAFFTSRPQSIKKRGIAWER